MTIQMKILATTANTVATIPVALTGSTAGWYNNTAPYTTADADQFNALFNSISQVLSAGGQDPYHGNLLAALQTVSGAYLPLTGGTCTGNVSIVESTTPTLTLNATGSGSTSQAILALEVNGNVASITHYVPAAGQPLAGHNVIYMGGYEDSVLAVDTTTPQVVVYGPLTTNGNIAIGSGSHLQIGVNTIIADGDFANDLAGNGFQKLPGGMTMQWGTVNLPAVGTSGSPSTIPFTAPFTHGCLSVTGSYIANLPPATGTCGFQVKSGDPANFYAIDTADAGTGPNTVSWFAIGY